MNKERRKWLARMKKFNDAMAYRSGRRGGDHVPYVAKQRFVLLEPTLPRYVFRDGSKKRKKLQKRFGFQMFLTGRFPFVKIEWPDGRNIDDEINVLRKAFGNADDRTSR